MTETSSSLIKAAAIAELTANTPVVFLDARGGSDAFERYLQGHLSNAHFIVLETDLSTKSEDPKHGGRHPLPTTEKFGEVLSRCGISPSTHVIVYDDKNASNAAARLWWMLKAIGHERVSVVDGGMDSIIRAGLRLSTGQTPATGSHFSYPVPASWQSPTVTIGEVEQATQDPDFLIIDVRENFRYRGESEPIDLTAGHIPTAINIPYSTNLEANGEFKPADELRSLYATQLDGHDSQKVIVHCGSGVTACHTLLALEVAGFQGASLYVGSWSEWSRQ